jgi:hypothetical protein
MKVNIKKEGKEETYNFISSWSDVTVGKNSSGRNR